MPALGTWILLMLVVPAHGTVKATEIDAYSLLTASRITDRIGGPADGRVCPGEVLQQNDSYSSDCIWTVQREGNAPADPDSPMLIAAL